MALEFIDRVEKLIEKSGVTKKDFAAKIGITQQAIYDWKKRQTIPSADIAVKIANYLNTSVEYLVTGSEPGIKTKIPEDLQEIINKYAE